ncbi:hypothetical protein KZX46_18100 [Polymorphobacter sp. PAMC 29334]|uniref:hypothetical protein n=1 Tax=Polymorphobacter sp. PAMC 29334 TaxID=2862331 RepID=UPI001C75EE4F|nr:hypothetical protein [Polymorphobacter sp. PAMC 29334]QYE34652.1 hypothetical protein KZX46_18100 [Polymorphobacter sp. PAMC 29334]
MKLFSPLPPPRLLPSKASEPQARPVARTPLEMARRAWRPDPEFSPPSSPSPGSLVERMRNIPRSRLIIGGVALLIVGAIMALFLLESRWGYSGKVVPVVFVKSWPATRSDADIQRERSAEEAAAHADAAASRAYIATLQGPARVKAQNQYDAFVSAQPKNLQPEGYVAPVPPAPPPSAAAPTAAKPKA